MKIKVMKKQVKVKLTDEMLSDKFKVKVGDILEVIAEAKGESKYGYLVNTKNKKSIVLYAHEVDVIEKKVKQNEN